MRRRLLNFATILSLVLLVANVALWARGYFVAEDLWWEEAESLGPLTPCRPHVSSIAAYSERGRFLIVVDIQAATGGGEGPGGWIYEKNPKQRMEDVATDAIFDAPPRPPRFEHLGILIRRDVYSAATRNMLAAPLWPISLLLIVAPAIWLKAHRRRRHGVCASCGYNLTGNVSGICPECGSIATTTRISDVT